MLSLPLFLSFGHRASPAPRRAPIPRLTLFLSRSARMAPSGPEGPEWYSLGCGWRGRGFNRVQVDSSTPKTITPCCTPYLKLDFPLPVLPSVMYTVLATV